MCGLLEVFDEDNNLGYARESRRRAVVGEVSCGVAVPSLCCWDSWPSHEVGGGLFGFRGCSRAGVTVGWVRVQPVDDMERMSASRTGSISTSVATTFRSASRPIPKLGRSGSTTKRRLLLCVLGVPSCP